MVHEIAAHDGVTTTPGHMDTDVTRGVAWRGLEPDPVG